MYDVIEFYSRDNLVCTVKSSMVPAVGDKINIRRTTYTVLRVTYAVDYADDYQRSRIRANVDLSKDD